MMKPYSNRLAAALAAVFFLSATLPAMSNQGPKPVVVTPTVDERIAFYSQKLKKHPTLFAVYPQLAAAYLDKARATNDVKWLQLAEANLHKSMQIQPNFEAYKIFAALYDYRHRFTEARKWGEKAEAADPTDTQVKALLVEADLGLGDMDTAMKRLPPLDSAPPDFFTAVAMATVLKAQQRYDEARVAYLKAEQFALEQYVTYLAVWARTNAAGMLIDSQQAAMALPDLEAASTMQKDNRELRRHWAEYYSAQGETARALEIVEALIKEAPHPSYHRQAHVLARKLGDAKAAQHHFAAAEKSYRLALKAKEIYPLGALAQLYCDADTRLDEALALARRNFSYKKDKEATDVLACVNSKMEQNKMEQKKKT